MGNRSGAREQARRRVREAFEAGLWVAATDACVGPDGRSGIAWGVWSPAGSLATCGSRVLEGEWSSVDAEAQAALAAAAELSRMGANAALCLCDCLPAIEILAGQEAPILPRRAQAQAQWSLISAGRYKMEWAPREALGPANDAARKAVGLERELKERRPWSLWLASLEERG